MLFRIGYIFSILSVVAVLMGNGLTPLCAKPVSPGYAPAFVDGAINEWDTNTNYSSELYKSSNDQKEVYGRLYLRFEPGANILYAMVKIKDDILLDTDKNLWIKKDNHKVVTENDVNSGQEAPNLMWIEQDEQGAKGFEAALYVEPGTLNLTVQFNVIDGKNFQPCGIQDLAVSISPVYDYSDAPAHRGYPNAKNAVNAKLLRLGNVVDDEDAPHDDNFGTGDDFIDASNDDDGVEFLKDGKPIKSALLFQKGDVIQLRFHVLNKSGKNVKLAGWIDFNGDGQFSNNEKVVSKVFNHNNNHQVWTSNEITIPDDVSTYTGDYTYSRFRLDQTSEVQATGAGSFGEVEDYGLVVDEPYHPVAIELTSLSAVPIDDGVTITWRVESETNHLGYNVYKCDRRDGTYRKINRELVSSELTGTALEKTYTFHDSQAQPGSYYKVEDVSKDGHSSMHGPVMATVNTRVEERLRAPERFSLEQNYPNPFNPTTTIAYTIPEANAVTITIYDSRGRMVHELVSGVQPAGRHNVTWDGTNRIGEPVPSGIYLYRMRAGEVSHTEQMTLLR